MDLNDAVNLATVCSGIATVVGVMAVLFQFRHLRAANFTGAWSVIKDELQADNVRIGRAVCRRLMWQTAAPLPQQSAAHIDWSDVLHAVRLDFPGHAELERLNSDDAEIVQQALLGFVGKAYDAFDLAAILAWHSRIPDLWSTVVAEWEDGIIATWEAGAPLLEARRKRSRTEMFECFSALYVSAVRHQRSQRTLYPYRSLLGRLRLWSYPRWAIALEARRQRDLVRDRSLAIGRVSY